MILLFLQLFATKPTLYKCKGNQKPVTIKIRKGFSESSVNAVEIAKIAEGSGAAAIAVHGRTRDEYYSGKADLDIIRQVKEAVKIPVIGSGDMYRGADIKRMLDETGCDGVMCARGARGNPWIFKEAKIFLETGKEIARPQIQEVKDMIMKHCRLMIDFAGEEMAIRQMRKHIAFYVTGYKDATSVRREVNYCNTLSELEETLTKWGR